MSSSGAPGEVRGDDHEVHPNVAEALRRFETFPLPKAPCTRLPLVDWLVDGSGLLDGSLEGVRVLFIQHHLGPLPARLAALRRRGLDPALCHFVDVPYSTNGLARAATHRGVPEEHVVPGFDDPLYPYCAAQSARVMAALRTIAEVRRGERLLVVDDGGYFPRALQTLRLFDPRLAGAFVGTRVVEQTTRGHREWERRRELAETFRLIVVSIARTLSKARLESPFIGASVVRSIRRQQAVADLRDGRTMVMGHGLVGRAVVEGLRGAGFEELTVVDPRFATGDLPLAAVPAGVRAVPMLPGDETADVVIGCTGATSLRPHQRRILNDGAVLASCSSAALEFNREGFVELADADPHDDFLVLEPDAARTEGIRATLRFQDGARTFSFLNAGFPINFDGAVECLPAHLIQVTHALLVGAMFEALRGPVGVRELSTEQDRAVHEAALPHLLLPLADG